MFSFKKRISNNRIVGIYQDHYQDLFHASFRITRDAELSEDICHDLFLDILHKQPDLNEIGNLKAYLRRAVTNNSIYRNKMKFDFVHIDENEMNYEEDNNKGFWQEHELKTILDAINTLPEGYRIITEKHLLDGLAHEEIASDLDIASSTSRSQYLRAKKQLRKTLLYEK